MRVTAKVSFFNVDNRVKLIQAFFNEAEFSPRNIINIKDDRTAYVEIHFDELPPQGIIKALSYCKVEDLTFSADSAEELNKEALPEETKIRKPEEAEEAITEDKSEWIEETISEDKSEVVEEAISEEMSDNVEETISEDKSEEAEEVIPEEQSEENGKIVKKVKRGRAKRSEADYIFIPVWNEIAKQSQGYNDFVNSICAWMGLDLDGFNYVVSIVGELLKLDQQPYELRMSQIKEATRTLKIPDSHRIKTSNQVKTNLEGINIYTTFFTVLITLMSYKDFFENQTENEDVSVENKAYCKELLLLKSPKFNEILDEMEELVTIRARVEYLYSAMGLVDVSPYIYRSFCNVTMCIFDMKNIDSIDDVLEKAGINCKSKNGVELKAKCSDWLNDFCKNSGIGRMKLIAFLREIKEILIK